MKFLFTFLCALFTTTAFALPTFTPTLFLVNQQGDKTAYGLVYPGTTFIAGKVATHTIPCNLTGSTAYPTACTYAQVQTALGIGTSDGTNIAALQNGTFTPQTEAVIAAGAISTTKMESTVSNVTSGTYAVTLAAPSGQDGQIKIIKAVTTMTHTVTLAMTNISVPGFLVATTGYSGSTTLTFTNAGDCVVLIAVGGKWQLVSGSAVAT